MSHIISCFRKNKYAYIYKHMDVFINNDRFLHGVLSYLINNKTIIDEVQYVTNIKLFS